MVIFLHTRLHCPTSIKWQSWLAQSQPYFGAVFAICVNDLKSGCRATINVAVADDNVDQSAHPGIAGGTAHLEGVVGESGNELYLLPWA